MRTSWFHPTFVSNLSRPLYNYIIGPLLPSFNIASSYTIVDGIYTISNIQPISDLRLHCPYVRPATWLPQPPLQDHTLQPSTTAITTPALSYLHFQLCVVSQTMLSTVSVGLADEYG